MRPDRITRRRGSPAWVQDLSTEVVHAMAGHLRREQTQKDLSEAQEWLWDRLMYELEWRNVMLPRDLRCNCDLCLDPFKGEVLTLDDWLGVAGLRPNWRPADTRQETDTTD